MRERLFITGLVVAVICGIAMAAYAQVTIPRTIRAKAPTPVVRDSDHDGVPDDRDQCPNSFYVVVTMRPGDVINAQGTLLTYPSSGPPKLKYFSKYHDRDMVWNFDTERVYLAGTGIYLKKVGREGVAVKVLINKAVIHPADGVYGPTVTNYGCSDVPGME